MASIYIYKSGLKLVLVISLSFASTKTLARTVEGSPINQDLRIKEILAATQVVAKYEELTSPDAQRAVKDLRNALRAISPGALVMTSKLKDWEIHRTVRKIFADDQSCALSLPRGQFMVTISSAKEMLSIFTSRRTFESDVCKLKELIPDGDIRVIGNGNPDGRTAQAEEPSAR